ncbi:MAG: XdhC family protein [Thermoanaerobaculaceae bacterium]|jgi:xanthine dehydrogenase accessory factor|nr:XdhC family protein [Thermoanaerobaculaceae bacterium]
MALDPYPDPFQEVVARRRCGERVVMATVVAVAGSAPRSVGARLLLLADGTIRGTVGGGEREAEIVEIARELQRRGGARLVTLDFAEGLAGGDGPLCGGRMEVFVEAIDPVRRVIVAGAGHVAYFLHRFLRLLDFRTVVIDPRAELATPERFPEAQLLLRPFEEPLGDLAITPADGIVIVTPEHRHDEAVLRQALATEAGYVGMIGSRRKVPVLLERLRRDGVSEEQLARVHAPIGLDIGAETPAEIALAIAAEIVGVFKGGVGQGRGGGARGAGTPAER